MISGRTKKKRIKKQSFERLLNRCLGSTALNGIKAVQVHNFRFTTMKKDINQVIKIAKKSNSVLWSISTGQINPEFVCLRSTGHEVHMVNLTNKAIAEYIELRQAYTDENHLLSIDKGITGVWFIDFYKIIQAV